MTVQSDVETPRVVVLKTRAVVRGVEPGTRDTCRSCGLPITFSAKRKAKKIIANVYGRDGNPNTWSHVETFHHECYEVAGRPHGDPT